MKRIFGFIGSPLREKSNTWTLTNMMLDKLVEMDGGITHEVLTAGDVKIRHCTGCWSCMVKGSCPLDRDKGDGMAALKQKMLEADFVIFGSPVYTMSVSGQMKTFLDRLAAWYHLVRLAGKPGLTVATTAGAGLEQVHELLEMLMSALGVKAVARLETRGFFPGMLADPGAARRSAERAAAEIFPYVTGQKAVESDANMDEAFAAMKQKVTFGAKWLPADNEYWKQHGMLELNSYSELLEKLRREGIEDRK